jgi:hypothetical protein
MKKTKHTFKSILDGIASYIVFYTWTAFAIWLGFHLMGLTFIALTYFKALGFVIVLRQTMGLLTTKTDRHIPSDSIEERLNVVENKVEQAFPTLS